MAIKDAPKKAYRFFRDRQQANSPFTRDELSRLTGWSHSTIETYITKLWREIIERRRDGKLSVKPEFQFLTERRFVNLLAQTKEIFGRYNRVRYEHVVQYEFLLPLRQEGELRKALDELFYEDTIKQRLSGISQAQMTKWLERDRGEVITDYLSRASKAVSERFGGYSISHVSGRFLVGELATRAQAAEMLANEESYIIDETTASVRFIIPLKSTKRNVTRKFEKFDKEEFNEQEELSPEVREEIASVHWLFFNVFAEAVVHAVEGEDVIWLVEETPLGRRLYEWTKGKDDRRSDGDGSLLFPE